MVDRHITITRRKNYSKVVDKDSNKICILLAKDALVSIAYTGIAVANQKWMDCVIAECLAQRKLSDSMLQPGAECLNRPINTILNELCVTLNEKLERDSRINTEFLKVSIVGFHFSCVFLPLCWEILRVRREDGSCYLKLTRNKVGKFLREHPRGLWGESLGDPGDTIDNGLNQLRDIQGLNHDDVERYISRLIEKRSCETNKVSPQSLGVQIIPYRNWGEVKVTFYPHQTSPLVSPWVLTHKLISSPSISSSSSTKHSDCGKYVLGGFEDRKSNFHVIARLPIEYKEPFEGRIEFLTKIRDKTC